MQRFPIKRVTDKCLPANFPPKMQPSSLQQVINLVKRPSRLIGQFSQTQKDYSVRRLYRRARDRSFSPS